MLESITKQWRLSGFAASPPNRLLAFLLGVHAGLGAHRRWARPLFCWMIDRFSRFGRVILVCTVNGRRTSVAMREGDRADYLVVGEFIQGGYQAPPVAPSRIVDAGGNIGTFSLAAAARFPGVPITIYEPDDANALVLAENLRENGIEANLVKKGVWSSATTLYFQTRDSYSGFISNEPSDVAVQCVVPDVASNDWLKLDVEGAEYEVLPALFAKGIYPYFISLELHHRMERGDDLLALARTNGYIAEGPLEAVADCINVTLSRP